MIYVTADFLLQIGILHLETFAKACIFLKR